MCGIAGVFNLADRPPPSETAMRRMLAMLRHRGPDEFGILLDDQTSLGSARLSIVDLVSGQQPVGNEDESLWIVYNGEVYNHPELRRELETRGHRFKTRSDTEVILHAYEEYGADCLAKLNGQFAFAIRDSCRQELFLARDRMGIRPLFYTVVDGTLVLASEIKALLAEGRVAARLDPVVLDQVFTFWAALSPGTVFEDIRELPPGHYLTASRRGIAIEPYWRPDFEVPEPGAAQPAEEALAEELSALLDDAVRLRLRADVPVGAYLSGGLDSSVIAALVQAHAGGRFSTFSIAFDDARFDESQHQLAMARHLGSEHAVERAGYADIGRAFPAVIRHTETPIMRTAPVPMFLLSQRVQAHGFKVVLTGEGADEFLGGYDLFKELKIRRFVAAQPDSAWRPLLLQRLYPDIAGLRTTGTAFLAAFFGGDIAGAQGVAHPLYSHLVRWRNNRRACRFFSPAVRTRAAESLTAALDAVALPARFPAWDPLQKAQYLEISILLSQYLLSSQGDRMAMAHSVEGRYPFLDHRLMAFCSRLPAEMKLRRLTEKYLLRRVACKLLPPPILERPKRPYRAPIHRCFFGDNAPGYVMDVLSEGRIRSAGYFDAAMVGALVAKLRQGKPIGESDDMALAGILSTQLLHEYFVDRFEAVPPIGDSDCLKRVIRLKGGGHPA